VFLFGFWFSLLCFALLCLERYPGLLGVGSQGRQGLGCLLFRLDQGYIPRGVGVVVVGTYLDTQEVSCPFCCFLVCRTTCLGFRH